jgi:ATPase subunit of ABC transporter with duplicated ATPase domains
MFVETVNVLSTGVGVIEVSKKLFPTFERVFKRLKNGDLKIAIFGAGGTGKTTLGNILAGSYELSELPSYRESLRIEQYQLDSKGTSINSKSEDVASEISRASVAVFSKSGNFSRCP